MKVLLVNPPPYQIVEPYYDTPDFPRTGIAYLAGHLRAQGVDVHVLDCKFDRLDYDAGLDFVKSLRPDVVGLGAYTNEIKPAAEFATRVKALDPSIQTIIGGVHVTALPEQTLREFPEFDYGVIGEGEETLHALLTALEEKATLEGIRGVSFLDESGSYQFGGTRTPVADQDTLAWPAWDMFRPAKEYFLHSSRGCPFACSFCMNPNGRLVRPRTPENVLGEIEWLLEKVAPGKLKEIIFGDEIFTVTRDRVMDICQGLIDRKYNERFTWWCQTHVRTVDPELVTRMKQSGCRLVGLGIESGDEAQLKSIGKGTSIQVIRDAVKVMKDADLDFMTFFILGQPNETIESAKNTIKLAVELNPSMPIFGLMVPYPGTKIAEMVERGEGGYIRISYDWNDYNKQFGNAVEFENISRKQLERLQLFGYVKVFLFNLRLIDLAKFMWQYRSEGVAIVKKHLRMIVRDTWIYTPFRPKST